MINYRQIASALNQGWWLVVPDFEGLNALYSAGLSSGYATLDSLRVALREGPKLGLSTKAKYALWGYSGGSIGSKLSQGIKPLCLQCWVNTNFYLR